jgi:hypothetical protein
MTLGTTWGAFNRPPATRVQPNGQTPPQPNLASLAMNQGRWGDRVQQFRDAGPTQNPLDAGGNLLADASPLRRIFTLGNSMRNSQDQEDPWSYAGFERINQNDPRFGTGVMRSNLSDGAGTIEEFVARPDTAAARLVALGAFKPSDDGRGWVLDVDKLPRMANGQTVGRAAPAEDHNLSDLRNRNAVFNDPNYGPVTDVANYRGNQWLAMLPAMAAMGMGFAGMLGPLGSTMNSMVRGIGNGLGRGQFNPMSGLSLLSRLWSVGGGG